MRPEFRKDERNQSAFRLLAIWSLIGLLSLGPIACQSSSGERLIRWPWRKDRPGALGGAPARNPDPFLPPPRASAQDADGNAAVKVRFQDPVVQLQRPKQPSLTLVSATQSDVESTSDASEIDTLLRPLAKRRGYQYIVLHHSYKEEGSLANFEISNQRQLSWQGCGYHFVVGNGTRSSDGQIEVSKRWRFQKEGAHVSSRAPDVYNELGIGICLVGNFSKQPPTANQIQATRELVSYLMQTYGIPSYRVLCHSEVTSHSDHGDRCPGGYFRIEDVLAGL